MLFFYQKSSPCATTTNQPTGHQMSQKVYVPQSAYFGPYIPNILGGSKSFDAQISENHLGKCCPLKGKNPVSSTLRALSFFCKARLFLFCARCSPKICMYPKSAPTGAF